MELTAPCRALLHQPAARVHPEDRRCIAAEVVQLRQGTPVPQVGRAYVVVSAVVQGDIPRGVDGRPMQKRSTQWVDGSRAVAREPDVDLRAMIPHDRASLALTDDLACRIDGTGPALAEIRRRAVIPQNGVNRIVGRCGIAGPPALCPDFRGPSLGAAP